MKFCSSCGALITHKIPDGDNRLRYVCESCGEIHYQNPKVIAGILPTYKSKVLLCKRSIQPRVGYWTLPAGFLENGESSLEGAIRECSEEANTQVRDPSIYAIFDIPQINQIYIFYRAEMPEAIFSPSTESSDVALFSEEDIPWSELAFPMVEALLDHYFEDRKSGIFEVIREDIRRPWKSKHSNSQDVDGG
jgi:ADP-ribose pyrophosphatase YjhB (NUDIX family)